MLHLRDLHCFIVVYELRNISRAADILDTVQSLVSARIHRLEEFSGAPLFLRVPRGVLPTGKGEVLYRYAKRVVRDIAELESAVRPHGVYDASRHFGRAATSEVSVAIAQLDALAKALEQYRLDTGRYPNARLGLKALVEHPSGEPKWHGPYLFNAISLDPWGKPYLYRVPGEKGEFDLVSLGRDGRPGGSGEDADISVSSPQRVSPGIGGGARHEAVRRQPLAVED